MGLQCLKIISIEANGTGCVVKWISRQSFQYSVLAGSTLAGLSTNAYTVTNIFGGAGAGDWLAAECQVVIGAQWTNGFYKVQLAP